MRACWKPSNWDSASRWQFPPSMAKALTRLYDALLPHRDDVEDDGGEDRADGPLRLAIIGQPNAGKSTLVNALLGEERMLTGPEAGITRDAISSDFEWKGQRIRLWDTAGIRRKSKVTGKIEKLAVSDALRAIRFAECVIVLIDASMPIETSGSDALPISCLRRAAPSSLPSASGTSSRTSRRRMKEVESKLEDVLPEIRGVPVVTLSAKQERGLDKLLKAVFGAMENWNSRISTAPAQPLARGGDRTQSAARAVGPPHQDPLCHAGQFAAAHLRHLRQPAGASLPDSYTRYLMNGLRKDFDLWGVPIRFSLRGGKNPFDKDR